MSMNSMKISSPVEAHAVYLYVYMYMYTYMYMYIYMAWASTGLLSFMESMLMQSSDGAPGPLPHCFRKLVQMGEPNTEHSIF